MFGSHFLDKYEYFQVYQKWADMNTNTIIQTDNHKYKCEYNYYCTKNIYMGCNCLDAYCV